jgi:hypothetical protein
MPNSARLSNTELSFDSPPMSSQSSTSEDPIISSQMAASSQITVSEAQSDLKRPYSSISRKRKATSPLKPEQLSLPTTVKQDLSSLKRPLSR